MQTIFVSGSSGFVGGALCNALARDGVPVGRFVRKETGTGPRAVAWTPEKGVRDPGALENAGGIVHLAGPNLAGARWTEARKRLLWEARVQGTRRIAEALARLDARPPVFVSVSAVGYFGNRGDEWLDEESAAGSGFLADLCHAWEDATEAARDAGIRVVRARLGIVLDPRGGALAKMLPAFRLGLGGRLGSGKQFMSWISLADTVRALRFALSEADVTGPLNVVAPAAVTNEQFTRELGRALRRPAILPVPPFALRLLLGEMADEALLAGQRVRPARLASLGFSFRDAELGPFLDGELHS